MFSLYGAKLWQAFHKTAPWAATVMYKDSFIFMNQLFWWGVIHLERITLSLSVIFAKW